MWQSNPVHVDVVTVLKKVLQSISRIVLIHRLDLHVQKDVHVSQPTTCKYLYIYERLVACIRY